MENTLKEGSINALVEGKNGAPHDILGPHQATKTLVTISAFRPTAKSMTIINRKSKKRTEMEKAREEGFFTVRIKGTEDKIDYYFEAETFDSTIETFEDPFDLKIHCSLQSLIFTYLVRATCIIAMKSSAHTLTL